MKYIKIFLIIISIFLLIGLMLPNMLCNNNGTPFEKNLICIQMDTVSEALKMFRLDNEMYPDTKEGLKALVSNPNINKYPNYSNESYIEDIPKDSWKTILIYIKTDTKYEIISFGADKKEGGEDDAKDIFFSKCKK